LQNEAKYNEALDLFIHQFIESAKFQPSCAIIQSKK